MSIVRNIPFHTNEKGPNCVPNAMWMILSYYFPGREYAWESVCELVEPFRTDNGGVWNTDAAFLLWQEGLDVKLIDETLEEDVGREGSVRNLTKLREAGRLFQPSTYDFSITAEAFRQGANVIHCVEYYGEPHAEVITGITQRSVYFHSNLYPHVRDSKKNYLNYALHAKYGRSAIIVNGVSDS